MTKKARGPSPGSAISTFYFGNRASSMPKDCEKQKCVQTICFIRSHFPLCVYGLKAHIIEDLLLWFVNKTSSSETFCCPTAVQKAFCLSMPHKYALHLHHLREMPGCECIRSAHGQSLLIADTVWGGGAGERGGSQLRSRAMAPSSWVWAVNPAQPRQPLVS